MRRFVVVVAAAVLLCTVAAACEASGTSSGANDEAGRATSTSDATPASTASPVGAPPPPGSASSTPTTANSDPEALTAADVCAMVPSERASAVLGTELIGEPSPEPSGPPQCAWNFSVGDLQTAINIMMIRPEDWEGYKGDLFEYVVDGYRGDAVPEPLEGPWDLATFIENDGSQTMVVKASDRIFVVLALDQPKEVVVAFAGAATQPG